MPGGSCNDPLVSSGRSSLERESDGLPARSFFSILTRYRPSPDRLPEEDSLTQCFCGVIEAVPALAIAVASEWTGWGDLTPTGIRVHTQVPAPGGRRRIDLEIVFPDADAALWIEVKHGSGLSGDQQLDDYWADLADAHADSSRRALVFLPPAGFSLTADQRPQDDGENQALRESDWQQTGASIARWLACTEAPSIDHYLASHFLAFLREEGLFVTRGFTADDHATLDRQHEAAAAFTQLVSTVRDRVNRDLDTRGVVAGDKTEWPARPRWGVLGTAWSRAGAAPDEPWLEWQLNSWDSSAREDIWKFSAGLGATTANQLEGVRDVLPAGYRSFLAGRHRLMKHLHLSDVEEETDPERQAGRVTDHILQSFTEVLRALERAS